MNDVLVVCISALYRRWMENHPWDVAPTVDEVLEMARWAWNCQRNPLPDLVIAEVRGEIKGVFVVDRWFTCGEAANEPDLRPERYGIHARQAIERDIEDNYKMAFIGHVAANAGMLIGGHVPSPQAFCYIPPQKIIPPNR